MYLKFWIIKILNYEIKLYPKRTITTAYETQKDKIIIIIIGVKKRNCVREDEPNMHYIDDIMSTV